VAVLKIPENFLCYLTMHENCNERLLARAGHLSAEDVEVSIHPEVARIKRMVYAVMGEAHRMKAFVRLSILGTAILYGFMKPRHKIGEHICDHFASRNAGMIVVLGNASESWISLCRNGRVWREHSQGLAETLERLKSALHCSEEGSDVEGLWQVYYDSQYCPERKNLAAFHRHMPRRDQKAAGLRLLQNKKNATLEDFL
jgi:probable DNA metabolism protein